MWVFQHRDGANVWRISSVRYVVKWNSFPISYIWLLTRGIMMNKQVKRIIIISAGTLVAHILVHLLWTWPTYQYHIIMGYFLSELVVQFWCSVGWWDIIDDNNGVPIWDAQAVQKNVWKPRPIIWDPAMRLRMSWISDHLSLYTNFQTCFEYFLVHCRHSYVSPCSLLKWIHCSRACQGSDQGSSRN